LSNRPDLAFQRVCCNFSSSSESVKSSLSTTLRYTSVIDSSS
jgi:hypothetical protein